MRGPEGVGGVTATGVAIVTKGGRGCGSFPQRYPQDFHSLILGFAQGFRQRYPSPRHRLGLWSELASLAIVYVVLIVSGERTAPGDPAGWRGRRYDRVRL
ncbi:hypothetical protein GGQ85_002251 [Nitrobacter vulgaris]|nr:hypothetical protein [Nitrobacter vulgaris]